MKKTSCLLFLYINLNVNTLNLPAESFLNPLANFLSTNNFSNNNHFGAINTYAEKSDFYEDYSFSLRNFAIELLSTKDEITHEMKSINWSDDFLSLFENSQKKQRRECPCKIRARIEAEKRRKAADSENSTENYFSPAILEEENETDKLQKSSKNSDETNKPNKTGCGCKGNRIRMGRDNKDYLNGGFKPWSRAAIHRRRRISQNIDYAATHGKR